MTGSVQNGLEEGKPNEANGLSEEGNRKHWVIAMIPEKVSENWMNACQRSGLNRATQQF